MFPPFSKFRTDIVKQFQYEPFDEQTFQSIRNVCQMRYPGNYTPKVYLDKDDNLCINLVFNDPEDATAFLLKYG